jgi:putative glycosyltransferase (TIGR04348 family)
MSAAAGPGRQGQDVQAYAALRYKDPMVRPAIGIVSPASPHDNTGNAHTARRWARMLAPDFRAAILPCWSGEPLDLLIALHARRSAASIAAWKHARGAAPLIVALTGTDLYRDIRTDAQAQHSLGIADALVVLQERGRSALPPQVRGKTAVIYQSAGRRRPAERTRMRRHLHALMVAHLRPEKSPSTLFDAARLLKDRPDIHIDLVGRALDPALGRQARSTARACPAFDWAGARSHAATLQRIQRAHVLINTSLIEGGAHVVLEAVQCGTPVLATRIDGNVGMLGAGYDGYFPPGDARALAQLLQRCRDEPRMLPTLARQCRLRAPLFEPARERRGLLALVSGLLRADGRG